MCVVAVLVLVRGQSWAILVPADDYQVSDGPQLGVVQD